MRKLDKHGHERKKTRLLICRGCHRQEIPSKFYIISQWEGVIQEDQEEYGFILDGTG
jgi:hypothetical protein